MKTDLKRAFDALFDLFFPELDGRSPYRWVAAESAEEAALRLDQTHQARGANVALKDPEDVRPCLAVLHRGPYRDPIVLMHGREFLRLLRRSEGFELPDIDWREP